MEKITKSHPFQWILHKCHLTSMCSSGQYAAFSVKKMHISKNYILFPVKCTQTTHNSNKITSQKKNITWKLLFCVNTSLFWSTQWKGNSSLWPYGPDKYRQYYCDRKTNAHYLRCYKVDRLTWKCVCTHR